MKELKGNTWFIIWSITISLCNLFIFLSFNTQKFIHLILGLMFLQLSYIFYVKYFYLKTGELEEQRYYKTLVDEAFKKKIINERRRK